MSTPTLYRVSPPSQPLSDLFNETRLSVGDLLRVPGSGGVQGCRKMEEEGTLSLLHLPGELESFH